MSDLLGCMIPVAGDGAVSDLAATSRIHRRKPRDLVVGDCAPRPARKQRPVREHRPDRVVAVQQEAV